MTTNQDITAQKRELKPKQKRFCEFYVIDWNGCQAYKKAYGACLSDSVCRTNSSRLLADMRIQEHIRTLTVDLEKASGISKLSVLLEHKKIAFSSIAHLHNTWVSRKDFDQLTEDQKASIQEITTQTRTITENEKPVEVEFVKLKLYSKQASLDAISRLLGYDKGLGDITPSTAPITGIQIIQINDSKTDATK